MQLAGDGRALFAGAVKPRRGYGLPLSLAAHAGACGLVAVAVVLLPPPLPSVARPPGTILTGPPRAAAAGSPASVRVRLSSRPRAARAVERAPLAPEAPPPQVEPEPLTADRAESSGNSSSFESPNAGAQGGLQGGLGVADGVPWGGAGDCGTCDGEGPTTDFDRPPRLLRQTRPLYPQEAFVKKLQGTVLVGILIDARGEVVATRVLRPVSPALDAAAEQAVRQWRFAPAVRQGRPVAVWAEAPVQFTID